MTNSAPKPAAAESDAAVARQRAIVAATLRKLADRGLVDGTEVEWAPFERALARSRAAMKVDASSITSGMARLLYALSAVQRPDSVLVAGSYQAAALTWLAVGAPFAQVLGLDIDPSATERARSNMEAMGLGNATALTLDGHAAGSLGRAPFDLVLLDAETTERGRASKGIYLSLLAALRDHLSPGGLVLAHDALWPIFAEDIARLRADIAADPGFLGCAGVPIDRYGLLVARRRP